MIFSGRTKKSQRTRGSSLMRQQRRLALEREVAELQQQLSNEETVHHVLERALKGGGQASVVAVSIPAFIPGKAKELLAELVLVEQEIARLEAQIRHMKGGVTAATVPAGSSNGSSPRTTADIKSMFFINQAMDGEYLRRHLANDTDKGSSSSSSRRSLDNNSSSNKQQQQQASNEMTKTRPQGTRVVLQQPNKLSERILKCLVCIFIRLLRSSRVAELVDKSGNNHSFSFRIDTGLNNVATCTTGGAVVAANRDKERGQQDHYAIFAIQDAIVRDVGPYKNLVRFTSSSLDLRGFSSSPLLTKLRGMLQALQQVDARSLNHQQRLAFWLNVYNTCIMHGILQNGLPSNPEKLLALKNKATINVSGQMFNALVIENFILRQPSSMKEELWKCDVDVEEQEVRGLYGLTASEPNILFALCCGIRSSPALRIYKADRVVADLEKAKLEYLQASLVVTSARRLMIPSLIHSNMHDFAKDMESLVRWTCEQLPTSWSLRKSMVDCLRRAKQVDDVVDVIPFDYDFQYLLPMM